MEKQRSFGEKQDEQLGDLIGSSKEQHIAQELKNQQEIIICPRYCFSHNRYFLRLNTTIPMPQDSLDFYQT